MKGSHMGEHEKKATIQRVAPNRRSAPAVRKNFNPQGQMDFPAQDNFSIKNEKVEIENSTIQQTSVEQQQEHVMEHIKPIMESSPTKIDQGESSPNLQIQPPIQKTSKYHHPWILKVLYRLSGVCPDIMYECSPASRAKFVSLGLLILIVSVAAFGSMSHMVHQIDGFGNAAIVVGLIWGFFWGVLEVLILSSAKSVGASMGGKIAAFSLRASVALVPVVSFATIWFVETNRPEIRVAVETLRLEREASSNAALKKNMGFDSISGAPNAVMAEIQLLKEQQQSKTPEIQALEDKLKEAQQNLNGATSRFYKASAAFEAVKGDRENSKYQGLLAKRDAAENEMKQMRTRKDSSSSELNLAVAKYQEDLRIRMEGAQGRLADANSLMSKAQQTFDSRSDEVSKTTQMASQDHFSSQLAGVYKLLESDPGKRWQFGFWFIALMLVEVSAIGMKVFVITDADVRHAHLSEMNMAYAEHLKNMKLAELRSDADVAAIKEKARIDSEILRAEVGARETAERLGQVSKALSPYEMLENYKNMLPEMKKRAADAGGDHIFDDEEELLSVAEKASNAEIRRIISRTPVQPTFGSFPRRG